MIETHQLHKRFGDQVAVEDVSFSAPAGRVTGLLGPNGAGKTTTLRMLYGLVRPDGGRAAIDGRDVAEDPTTALAGLGVLPDAPGLYGRLTAREHLRYAGDLQGMGKTELDAAVEYLVDLLDMDGIIDRRAQGFSQGERRKVALARALIHDPPNVVLDEPSGGLDVMSSRALRRVIRGLAEAGKCVLFSSHIMQEVSALCDRVVVVARGRVVAEGT
ncbi:MAG: ATP-binding cassette domain-containing protein, partial [Acidobacteriota bacterium]